MKAVWIGLSLSLALSTGINSSAIQTERRESAQPDNCNHHLCLVTRGSSLEQEAEQLYQQGKLQDSIPILQQAVDQYIAQSDSLRAAQASRNLALVYLKLQEWKPANRAIEESLAFLRNLAETSDTQKLTASTLEVKGQLQLLTGQPQAARTSWKTASSLYQEMGDITGLVRTQVNQAQALQAMGFYADALKLLKTVEMDLADEPDTVLKAKALQSLGDIFRGTGELEDSEALLQQSIEISQELQASEETAIALISLGNTQRAIIKKNQRINFLETDSLPRQQQKYRQYLKQLQLPLDSYQKAAQSTGSPLVQAQAQLNQLNLLAETGQRSQALELIEQLKNQLENLSPGRASIYARINFVQSLITLNSVESPQNIGSISETVQFLQESITQAQALKDLNAEVRVRGILGKLYETNQQLDLAEAQTRQALSQISAFNDPEIAYQLSWQLGRIAQAKGNTTQAKAAYTQAVDVLRSLRKDIVAISSEVQFDFREQVEPVYRELVNLLLTDQATQEDLEQAREVIEALQLAELDNFFRDACLNIQPYKIDQLDPNAAVFYTIILPDRLEVILALPDEPLVRYTTTLSEEEINSTLIALLQAIVKPNERDFINLFLNPSQQVYNWLIRPIETELKVQKVETLVFVPDGWLRNIPLSSLHDGEQYLVEKYETAIAPSLQLIDPKPLNRQQPSLLLGGLSEARQGYSPLPNVELEVKQVSDLFDAEVLLNQTFTESKIGAEITGLPYTVVHMATHGEFSSNLEGTFLLTWDEKIEIEELRLLLSGNVKQENPIELLVLSACATAEGDKRAALGLAGMAVRSGARSTVASLWTVDDRSTALLMTYFYQELAETQATKAEALRRAQQRILQEQGYSHPYFWSGFILVGNWL